MAAKHVIVDGNACAATVAHATSEVIAIYPITPSSAMGEYADAKSAAGETNIWGTVPNVTQMQSEAGAAAAVHGALCSGALATTFTASQGLLLMIPTMYKIAGELMPTVFHVSARALACQALSIFGDHSDVMTVRETGFAMLASNSVQEVGDMALVATAATLDSRVPFVHFFDGFRTSNEYQKIAALTKDQIRAMIDDEHVRAHRERAMSPDHPTLRGTAQNPDVYFIGRESVNRFYDATPAKVEAAMDRLADVTGRRYHLFDYVGAPDAEHVAVIMGSGAEAIHEVVDCLVARGEKVGLLKVRLYRPWSSAHFAAALPRTVKRLAVLDRTKEPGSLGEPLYLDVRTAVGEALESQILHLDGGYPLIIGGRYGLGSAEFNAGMAKAVFDSLKADKPKNHFTVGINDDVGHSSLPFDEHFDAEKEGTNRAMFFGLGGDGTVGANRNTVQIIGQATDSYAQAYFVYDSKKAGAMTTSHLRFSPTPIRSTYLISEAEFVACHKFSYMEKYGVDMLSRVKPGGTFLLESPYGPDEVWDQIPDACQRIILDKNLRFYVIDAIAIARESGMGEQINVVMQTAHFAIANVLPMEQALRMMKDSVIKTYGKKGPQIVEKNIRAMDAAATAAKEVRSPGRVTSSMRLRPHVPQEAPPFVKNVLGEIMALRGDKLPMSQWPVDGVFPVGTTQYEKRNIAIDIPVWHPERCIQCGQCSLVCPSATIRMKAYDPALLTDAPATFKSVNARGKELEGLKYTVQVAPEDCTGCGVCVNTCPGFGKDAQGNRTEEAALVLSSLSPLRSQEIENWQFFQGLPDTDPARFKRDTLKGSQFLPPMFEFSGCCSGCGETPYVKLLSQLFGDRAIITNATGCSSIYGGNLPTTPWTTRFDGRGPAWNNSLFEDTAEATLGVRLSIDKQTQYAAELCARLRESADTGDALKALLGGLLEADQTTQQGIEDQRARVAALKTALASLSGDEPRRLLHVADNLVRRSVWGVGGDGWAYDIGYGGLDHVIASGRNINLLVLDTEVYSNTGGQSSKATPQGAIAKFAAGGKAIAKKDLGLIAMTYGNVYVAKVALGANMNQVVKAFNEAEAYDGPSIIIAYAHCIAHGINMKTGMEQQKKAVASGAWVLYRFNPELLHAGKNPLKIDSRPPTVPLEEYIYRENRFLVLRRSNPEMAARLLEEARTNYKVRHFLYEQLAKLEMPADPTE